MADEPNNNGKPNGDAGKPPANPNADGGDTTNKGDAGKDGEGKTIPVESYNAVRDKYLDVKKKLEEREAADTAAEKQRLEEQGKYKELAEKAEREKADVLTKFERSTKVASLKVAALEAGTVDADAVASLVDLGAIKLTEDGSVDGDSVKKVIEDLKTAKAYLFGKQQKPNMGADGGNPANGGGDDIPTFKRSQLKNSAFYKEHEKDILRAAAAGKIVDDITQQAQ